MVSFPCSSYSGIVLPQSPFNSPFKSNFRTLWLRQNLKGGRAPKLLSGCLEGSPLQDADLF
jgi:hypothetical protein